MGEGDSMTTDMTQSDCWLDLFNTAASLTGVDGTPEPERLYTKEAFALMIWRGKRTYEQADIELAGLALFARMMAIPTTAERAARFKKWLDALPQEWREFIDAP